MTWRYVQRTGHLYGPNGKQVGIGYSGHGAALNNPEMQASVGVGPLPCGTYRIGPAHQPIDHLGPLAMPLIPAAENHMFGRSGFFIHGDNVALNHTASNGCIILAHGFRQTIDDSDDDQLVVVAEESEIAASAAVKGTEP